MENEAGPAFNATRNSANPNGEQHEPKPMYSIPGILHFIQHEWTRFEMERAQWEVERAELQARIAFLQGERRGQENLKKDLVRRIKMLEYALKQERQKFHKLKYGTDLKLPDIKDDANDEYLLDSSSDLTKANAVSFNYRQGRQILRQYLQEIGYTEKVLELRSARVRVLLGLTGDDVNQASTESSSDIIPASSDQTKHNRSDLPTNAQVIVDDVDDHLFVEKAVPARRAPSPPLKSAKRHQINGSADNEDGPVDNDEAALDSFNFLQNESTEDLEGMDEDIDDGGNADDELDEKDDEDTGKRGKGKSDLPNDVIEKVTPTDEALKEFDYFSEEQRHVEEVALSGQKESGMTTGDDWHVDQGKLQKLKEAYKKERRAVGRKDKRPNRSSLQSLLAALTGDDDIPPPPSVPAPPVPGFPSGRSSTSDMEDGVPPLGDVALPSSHFGSVPVRPGQLKQRSTSPGSETMEVAIGLGDLAGLTVSNEASPLSVDADMTELRRSLLDDPTPKEMEDDKYDDLMHLINVYKSHFDGVRSLAFHPFDSALVTAGEDSTVKLWSLQRNTQLKKGSISDIEPVYTFRGHNGPVLSVVMNTAGNVCYSGSTDATIQCWNLPALNLEPFGPYDPDIVGETLIAHTDCVWDLDMQAETDRLLSCAADGTCRLWNPLLNSPLLCTYSTDNDIGNPTSVTFINTDPGQMAASYTTSQCIVYDLETSQPVVKLNSGGSYTNNPATQINKVISHPTLPLLITAHEDRHIRVFDINSGEQIHTMVAHLDAVTCLSIDPTGLYILSGSHDGSIRLWNMDNKTCIQEITAHRKKFDEAVFDVAFHLTQPLIASTGADAMAKVFV